MSLFANAWVRSVFLHLLVVLPLVFVSFFSDTSKKAVETIDFEIIEKTPEKVVPLKKIEEQVIDIQQKKPKEKPSKVPPKPVKRVFGISKDTLTKDGSEGLTLKQGNTIAKKVDKEKLTSDEALPVPKPEYLVSQMPVLLRKPDIPYPPEARKKELEGRVVLSILIDDQGKVRDAKVLQGLAFGLSQAAEEAIYKFVFKPAQIDGKNVPVRIRYVVTFELRT